MSILLLQEKSRQFEVRTLYNIQNIHMYNMSHNIYI